MSRSRADAMDKYDVTDGVDYVDTPEDHTFRWQLSPKQFNFGYRCFGLYRYILTQGTLSRGLAHSSCYILYRVYKDKLQNCSCNQFHFIGTYKQMEENSMAKNRGGDNGSEK